MKPSKSSKKPAPQRKPARGAAKPSKRPSKRPGKQSTAKEDSKARKGAGLRRAPLAGSAQPVDERGRREALAVAKTAIAAALDKKAVEPVLIDVSGRASYADFIAVVSGRSDRQVDAITEGVCDALAALGRRPLGREGARNGRWSLIDFGDLVVHVFYHPLREVFDIESLWIDAPRIKLQIPAEARADAAPGRGNPA